LATANFTTLLLTFLLTVESVLQSVFLEHGFGPRWLLP